MKKEKIILLLIVLLVIVIFCIMGLILILKHTEEEAPLAAEEVTIHREIESNLKQVTNRNNFYIVQSCVEKFYMYYSEIFDEEYEGYLINTEEDKEKIKAKRIEKVYKMLDDEYIEYEGLTLENLATKLPKTENTSILIKDMYCVEKNERITVYFVYGTKKRTSNSEEIDFSIMIKVDLKNRTFKLSLGEQVENYYKEYENSEEIEIKEDEIPNEEYNIFTYDQINESEYMNDLFAHYKKAMRFSKEYSYDLLDETYKNICFANLEDYVLYLDSNYSKIITAKLEEYSRENKNGYTEYLFKDKNGNYYIFKETAPFKYTVILDDYTIPTEYFIEQYNSSSEAQKVVLNIKKFFMGIDDKNYGYSYSLLSDSFKNNKYATKEAFVNYAKNNFFDENEIEFVSYEKENGLYIYEIRVTDATGESIDEKTFNMIVKLNSGTGFEMSFGEE